VLDTATKVALRVFSRVLVEPADEVYESSIPASWRNRLTAGEATRPVPRGAGISWEYFVSLLVHAVQDETLEGVQRE
jgi:hypothetical protein